MRAARLALGARRAPGPEVITPFSFPTSELCPTSLSENDPVQAFFGFSCQMFHKEVTKGSTKSFQEPHQMVKEKSRASQFCSLSLVCVESRRQGKGLAPGFQRVSDSRVSAFLSRLGLEGF